MPLNRHLQEVMFAAHLVAPMKLDVRRLAQLIDTFSDDGATIDQMAPLPPAALPGTSSANPTLAGSLTFQIGQVAGELPRIRLLLGDGHTLFVFQSDRFAFGWRRSEAVGSQVDYPGFQSLQSRWAEVIDQVHKWAALHNEQLSFRLAELDYNNAYPLEVEGQKRRLKDVFKLIDVEARPVNAFMTNWSEPLDDGGSVNVSGGIGLAPPGTRVFGLNYFGLAGVGVDNSGGSSSDLLSVTDVIHTRILDIHQAAIASEP